MKLTVKELVLFALLGSILTISQLALSIIPNVELVTFFIILFTLVYGKKTFYSVALFIILEGIFYGIGPWWFGYIGIWPLLVCLTLLFKKWFKQDFLIISLFAGFFGLIFGALFAVPYLFIGNFTYALTFWLNGLPFDLIHMVGNYFIMLVIGELVYKTLSRLNIAYIYKTS